LPHSPNASLKNIWNCKVAIAALGHSMTRSLAIVVALLLGSASFAQSPGSPIPLFPAAPPRSYEPEPLPAPATELGMPGSPGPIDTTDPVARPAGSPIPPPAPGMTTRTFCQQPVTVRIADRASVPERYREFLGMWSDAAWTAQLCAALVVENVASDGTATILYAFGPIGSNARVPGGVLNGTGIVQDGELRFQNSDGSQFAFRPLYADLDGQLTTPQGQSYRAIFKKTP
jgi:hypothetical protein